MQDGYDEDEPFVYRLNDNGSGPSLLVKVCAERGWRMYHGYADDKWNLWWRTSAFPAASYKTLGDWQFMNHIPKGGSICRKDNLSRLLRCMRRIYGAIYDFSPPCYHLPLEYAKLVTECSRLRRSEEGTGANVVWIHKPVAQSQGRGIFLFRSVCEMRCGSAAVVQRYIERPLLIAGYKFDLRLYVCVPGYRPLTAYMYAEGLARFGTDKYTLSDIHNPYRHLTNSSLNKTGPRYAECKERIGSGCKWTLKQVRRALMGRWGAVEWLVWQRIRALVTLTLLAQAAGTPPTRNCFEFYGFDVLLDDSLKPWLIEVNLSPALAADCEADVAVKQPMLHELFDLLGLPMRHTGLAQLQGPHPTMLNSSSASRVTSLPSKAARVRAASLDRFTVHSKRKFCLHQDSKVENSQEGEEVCTCMSGDSSNCSSEDESGVPRMQPRVSSTGTRRGTRRRRTMAIACVNIQPPMPDKVMFQETTAERNKETHSGRAPKTASEIGVDPDNSSGSSACNPTESTDESWRGGYATAASRRRILSACSWGNGVRWDRAVGRVGQWVRIYPHTLPQDDQLPIEDARESVAQVSKFIRCAREVAREGARDTRAPRDEERDATFEGALQKKLACGPHFQVWLPPA